MHELSVAKEMEGARVDQYLVASGAAPSRSRAKQWIEEGYVLVNGARPSKAGVRLQAGDRVHVSPPAPPPETVVAEKIPLDILFEDDHIIVINKPKGMVVHPAPGHWSGTLVNALLHHAPGIAGVGGEGRPGIVHRLDRETSGVLVVAKTDAAYQSLVRQLMSRSVTRVYFALVHGRPRTDQGTIMAPIGRHPVDRKRMAVVERGGKEATTHFTLRESYGTYSLLEVVLETGRTHQIRVHLAYIGHPVVGDVTYGPKSPSLFADGQALHASRLAFLHPQTGALVSFDAPLPADFERVLTRLRAHAGSRTD